MELRYEPATRIPRPPWWAVAITVLWLGLVISMSSSFAGSKDAPSLCQFKRLTGVPCAACGGSRGARAILDGQPQKAWSLNPLLFSVITVWLAFSLRRLITGQRVVARFSPRGRIAAYIVGFALFFAGWGYVIWRQGIA